MKRKPNAAAIAREELVRQLARGLIRNECLPDIAARLELTPAQARDLIFETHRAGEWSHALRTAAEEKTHEPTGCKTARPWAVAGCVGRG